MELVLPTQLVFKFLKTAKADYEMNQEASHYMHIPKNIVACFDDGEHFLQFLIAAAIIDWPELVQAIKKRCRECSFSKQCRMS